MAKQTKKIQKHLKIYSGSSSGFYHPEELKKCIDFLNTKLEKYISPRDESFNDEKEIIARLEIVEKAARRIACAITAESMRRENELPDNEISFDAIQSFHIETMRKLKKHAKAIVDILREGNLPFPVSAATSETTKLYCTSIGTVGQKVMEKSLVTRLNDFIKSLDEHLPKKKNTPTKIKKGKAIYRLKAIYALTDAWIDITGNPPERLKRNKRGECYGEFFDFMKEGLLPLFRRTINTEKAVKEAHDYYKKTQILKEQQRIARKTLLNEE